MNKTIWAIVAIIIVVVGGWFLYQSMKAPAAPATTTDTTGVTTNTATNPAAGLPDASSVYLTVNNPTKGSFMTDPSGITLYTFDNDKTPGQSSCTGACATAWPAYTTSNADVTLPTNVSLIVRSDGTHQYAYNGKPLYYYAKDTGPGTTLGDGVGGTWHIVKM